MPMYKMYVFVSLECMATQRIVQSLTIIMHYKFWLLKRKVQSNCIRYLKDWQNNICDRFCNKWLCNKNSVSIESTTATSQSSATSSQSGQTSASQSDAGPIRAPAPMWRCSRIMHMQRDLHPTILSSLEGIVDQVLLLGRFICYEKSVHLRLNLLF